VIHQHVEHRTGFLQVKPDNIPKVISHQSKQGVENQGIDYADFPVYLIKIKDDERLQQHNAKPGN
jgi:hypothetical protein